MKTYKPFLLLTVLIWSSLSYAFNYSCIGKDDTVAPNPQTYVDGDGNTQFTDPMKAWQGTHSNWSASKDWGCCEKLVLDGRTCKDPSVEDTSLKKCSAHGECGGELGCYPMTDDDMWNPATEDDAAADAMAIKENEFEQQQSSLGDEDPKEAGQACYRNMECESYNCKNFKCEQAETICRLADKEEIAPGAIKCDEGLSKDTNLVCIDASISYFNGLLGDILVTPKAGGTSCEFELYPSGKDKDGKPLTSRNIQGAVNLGIKTLRSMEWLYSTSNGGDDCLFTQKYMKDEMIKLIDIRKEILKAYNEDMLYVENNFKIISGAQAENQDTTATLCADESGNYEVATFHDIAMRKSTGIDFLCYMKARNILYKEYELAMKDWTAKLQVVTTAYRDTVFNFGEKDKNWTTGSKSYSYKDRNCRNWPKWHKKVKRRWSRKYKVRGHNSTNKMAIDMPGVTQYLSFVGNANASKYFKSSRYYLIDPLMPSLSYGNFGGGGFFGGTYERTLGGGNGLIDIYSKFDGGLQTYLKTLRTDTPPETFILEPEISGSYEMRGCLDNRNRPECEKFNKYVTEIKDFAFAQFLAYSRHYKKKYKRYFKSEGTWRRQLYNRYDVDLVNLQKYYSALSDPNGLRSKQNDCLDRLINGINKDFTNTEGTGIATGVSNYYKKSDTNYLGGGGQGNRSNIPKIQKSLGTPQAFKLRAFNNSLKDNGGLKDSSSSKTGAGSGAIDGESVGNGLLASRVKKMNEANEKATKSGVDVAMKSQELTDSLAKAGLISGGSSLSAAAGNDSNASTSGASGKKASLDDEVEEKKISSVDPNLLKGNSAGAGSGLGTGVLSGIGASSSGYGNGSSEGSGTLSNPSGMSDEEKDIMAANYDRTRSKYKTNEDDSLFQVLSKTYVRNLDKILTRKKKLDEGAASFPSEPSKP